MRSQHIMKSYDTNEEGEFMRETLRNKLIIFLKVDQEFVDRKTKFTWKSSLEKRDL